MRILLSTEFMGVSNSIVETIEEIGAENKGYFVQAGGGDYHYIPALNSSPAHIETLAEIIAERN